MRLVLLLRDGVAAEIIAARISAVVRPSLMILESGRAARRRKRRRMLRRGFPWRLPLTLLDALANRVYQWLWRRYLRERMAGELSWAGHPEDVPQVWVNSVNDAEARHALERTRPDVVVVFGTSILRGPTLNAASRHTLNLHGGIVPGYRNVHSEAWAVLNDDRENVGVSVIHLDEGIDSGAIALQRRLPVETGESFFDIRFRNLLLLADVAAEALQSAGRGDLPSTPQDESKSGFYPTPGTRALLELWWKSRSR